MTTTMAITSHTNSILMISLANLGQFNHESIDDFIYAIEKITLPRHVLMAIDGMAISSNCPGDLHYWRQLLRAARAIRDSILKFHITEKKWQ